MKNRPKKLYKFTHTGQLVTFHVDKDCKLSESSNKMVEVRLISREGKSYRDYELFRGYRKVKEARDSMMIYINTIIQEQIKKRDELEKNYKEALSKRKKK